MQKLFRYSPVLLGLSVSSFVSAQSSNVSSPSNQPSAQIEEIVVKANPLLSNGSAQAFTILSGDELAEKIHGSIGETVTQEAGIQSASFGSAVGRPVIHGLGAARVKITQDRIDSLDVSVASPDHAVSVEPFIANQITILKGASTLLYGSGAIGGVVDVQTGRVPTELTGKPLSGRIELRFQDNANAETAAVRLDGELKNGIAWHVDAFSKEADDFEIPGLVESRQLQEQLAAQGEALSESTGELAGSSVDGQGGAIGLSYITDKGFIGLSVSRTQAEYGLINGEGEAPGLIDLEQTRVDVEAQFELNSTVFEKINFRFGINDYEHQEIEGSGEVGTFFENDAWEGRLELTHTPVAGFSGIIGIQLGDREFSAIGEEAFVGPVDSGSAALFWVAERSFSTFDLEAGVRIEEVNHNPSSSAFEDTDFTTGSASLGGIFKVSDEWALSALVEYSSRAPTIEELFSNGPHLATQTFEIGDPDLDEEAVIGLTFTSNYNFSGVDLNATVYYLDFDDFIYQLNTGEIEDDLPVLQYVQDDGTFVGIDFKASINLLSLPQGNLGLSLLFDVVDATVDVDGNDNLPRIPAQRFGFGVDWQTEKWDVKFNYLRVNAQNEVSDFELGSDAYDDVSLRVSKAFEVGDSEFDFFIHGRNLTDDDQRNHVSFIKDFAPGAGRRFEAGIRYQF